MHLMPVFRPTCQYRRGFRNEPPTPTNEKSLHLAQATSSADTPLRETTLTPGTLRELPSGRRWNWRRGACFLGDRPLPKRYDGNTQRSGGTEDGRAKVYGRRTDRHGEAKSGSKSAMMMRNSWRLERRASWRMAAQRRNAAPAHETPPHHFSTAFPSVSPFPYYHTDFQPWLTLRSSLTTTRRRWVDH